MTQVTNTENDVEDTDLDTEVGTDTDTSEWVSPTREEYEALMQEKAKADSQAATRKRLLRDLGYDKNGNKMGAETSSSEKATTVDSPKADVARIAKDLDKKYSAVYAGLAAEGVPAGSISRLARFIDISEIDVDGDEVEGVLEQIRPLKADYPELFKRPRAKATDASVVGAGKKPTSSSSADEDWETEVRRRFNNGQL